MTAMTESIVCPICETHAVEWKTDLNFNGLEYFYLHYSTCQDCGDFASPEQARINKNAKPLLWTASKTAFGKRYKAQAIGESYCGIYERLIADDEIWKGATVSLAEKFDASRFNGKGLAITVTQIAP